MIASAEDKAKVKEAIVPFIIGTAVIFGAFTIWSLVINIGQSISKSESAGGSTSQYTIPSIDRPVDLEQ